MFDFRSFFNNFPYTDFHELNLDFILSKIGAINGAVEEATEAATTATEAAGTAQSASFTAVEASQAAVSAKNSALTAKFDAESARDAAQTAATNAASSATAASQRAAAALAAQTAAESARDAAQTARTGAETARTGAETARTGAETARTGAETARTGAETAATNAANSATAAANSATAAAASAESITFVRRSLGNDANFDSVTDAGFYIFGSTTNSVSPPGNLTNAYLFVINNSYSPLVCQIAWGGRSPALNTVYVRQYYGNSWQPWRELLYNDFSQYAYNATMPPEGQTTTDVCSYRASIKGPVKSLRLYFYVRKNVLAGTNLTVGTLDAAYRPVTEYTTYIPITASVNAELNITTSGVVTLKPTADVALSTSGKTVTVTYI